VGGHSERGKSGDNGRELREGEKKRKRMRKG
jgi:hypothetical protein